jgi:hypothetical protein
MADPDGTNPSGGNPSFENPWIRHWSITPLKYFIVDVPLYFYGSVSDHY